MLEQSSLTYASSGVDYRGLDAFKRLAQAEARKTAHHLERLGAREISQSRGESAFAVEFDILPTRYVHVHEGLGTKNLVADAMHRQVGGSAYDKIAQDTVAMILNDLATVGAVPLTCAMHLGVGNGDWFNLPHAEQLARGWRKACDLGRATWGGGETATLKGVIDPRTVEISGSATGIIRKPSHLMLGEWIEDGDVIVLVGSNGVHANGLTLARKIAKKIGGYDKPISDGRMYGHALLDPTLIYSALVEDCQDAGIPLHYAVHISGHGWRKLMRAPQPLRYEVDQLPKPQPIFRFIQEHGPVEEREMYGNYNMGAGFAMYVPKDHALRVQLTAEHLGLCAWVGGTITKADKSSVVLAEKDIVFHAEELEVR